MECKINDRVRDRREWRKEDNKKIQREAEKREINSRRGKEGDKEAEGVTDKGEINIRRGDGE